MAASSEEDELESLELDELLDDDFVCTAFGAAGRLADLALGAALAAGRPGRPFAFALAFALGRATKISEMCGTVPSEHCDTSEPNVEERRRGMDASAGSEGGAEREALAGIRASPGISVVRISGTTVPRAPGWKASITDDSKKLKKKHCKTVKSPASRKARYCKFLKSL